MATSKSIETIFVTNEEGAGGDDESNLLPCPFSVSSVLKEVESAKVFFLWDKETLSPNWLDDVNGTQIAVKLSTTANHAVGTTLFESVFEGYTKTITIGGQLFYTHEFTGLSASTTYYLKAWAISYNF